MSTYWYLKCLDHDPPLWSGDEIEQHTYGLDSIRELVARRAELAAVADLVQPDGYFERNAVSFLVQHPKCRLEFESEYGETQAVEKGGGDS